MDICRIGLTGHCKEYKRGTCDLIHIKDFCQNGIECKDKACLEGLQKRHVMKCSQRKRWENGEICKFPSGGWKSCSYYHPELAKIKVRIKEKPCGKCDKIEIELESLKSTVEAMKNGSNIDSINLVSSESTSKESMEDKITNNVLRTIRAEFIKDESAVPKKMETPAAEKMEIVTKEFEKLKAKHEAFEKEVKSVSLNRL